MNVISIKDNNASTPTVGKSEVAHINAMKADGTPVRVAVSEVGGGASDWDDIENKPENLAEKPAILTAIPTDGVSDNAVYSITVSGDEFVIPAAPIPNYEGVAVVLTIDNENGVTMDATNAADRWYNGKAPSMELENGKKYMLTILCGSYSFGSI